MTAFTSWFSVKTIACTLWDYPLSYIELIGTVFYLWSVWLISQRRILTWPIGIISVLLYLFLFYQIRLYGDALEQVYYLFASGYGWWHWSQTSRAAQEPLKVNYSPVRHIVMVAVVTAVLSYLFAMLLSRVHILLPAWFPEKASYPALDAATTMMSFTAMWLMARQRIESWVYWIIVDVFGIGLYYVKGVLFLTVLYVVLLWMATRGFIAWRAVKESTEN